MNEKIIVYDPNEDNLKVAELSLKDNYQVLTSSNRDEIIDHIINQNNIRDISAILLEAIGDGFEIYQELKRLKEKCKWNVKLGFLTVAAQKEYVEKGKEIGVDFYFTKPYDPFDLAEQIKRISETKL